MRSLSVFSLSFLQQPFTYLNTSITCLLHVHQCFLWERLLHSVFSLVAVLGSIIVSMLFKYIYLTQSLAFRTIHNIIPEDLMRYSPVYFPSLAASVLVRTLWQCWLQLILCFAFIRGFFFLNSCSLGYCFLSYNSAADDFCLNIVFCS